MISFLQCIIFEPISYSEFILTNYNQGSSCFFLFYLLLGNVFLQKLDFEYEFVGTFAASIVKRGSVDHQILNPHLQ